jgi:hypothetical protein
MTNLSDLFLVIAGALLSLLFTYFPVLKDWYEKQSGRKALIMLGLIVIVAATYFALGCFAVLAQKLGILVPCTTDGAITVALAVIKILIGNQTAYLLTKKK